MKRRYLEALVIATLLMGGIAHQTSAGEGGRETTGQAAIFLPFDFYPRHREELGLNEEQVREMQRIADSTRESAQILEGERGKRTKALQETMSRNPVSVESAMERFQAVLEAENELKSLQFRSGIEMRNTLRPEQLKNLHALATKDGASRGVAMRADFSERLRQLRAEIHKLSGGEPSPEVVEQIKEIEQAARDGRFGQAKNQLEQLLRRLRGVPN
jgi:hypothetical protein